MTTLSDGTSTLTIGADLLWGDEFDFQPVEVKTQYSVTGALIVESAAKQAGRPITLTGGDTYGWITRTTLLALRAWAATPGTTYTLTLRGVPYTVALLSVAARPVIDVNNPNGGDFYIATVSCLEV